ncbi:MAG: amino acid permease, partial [Deltaproteobacteria bacterium]|nr:amino acid permease [Deltaproteobacteria bacterium]
MSTPSEPVTSEEAPRVIGPLSAFSIVAGSMIGVGIFIFTPQIAKSMGSVEGFFGMLLLGGLFAYAGSVACGELGAMMPRAGGDYVFQREAFGPSMAFGTGWVLFAAIFAGSTALMSVAVFQFDVGPLLGIDLGKEVALGLSGAQLLAIALIIALTTLNTLGTGLSANIQTVLTLAPIALLVGIAAWVLVTAPPIVNPPKPGALAPGLTIGGFAAGFIATNFIFSGWINIIYVAAEVKEPGRNIPRAMTLGTAAVTALYILLGALFVIVLGLPGIAGTYETGTATADALGSKVLSRVVLVGITVAILTSINATVLAAGRVGYAMGKAGAFLKSVGVLSGRHRTPARALWIHAAIATLIVITGTSDAIGKMTSIAMFVTGGLTVTSLFVLRRKRPEMARPYKAFLYPVLPGLYVLLAVLAVVIQVNDAFDQNNLVGWYPLIGVGILAVTWVGHLLYSRKWKQATVVGLSFLVGGLAFGDSIGSQTPARAAVGAAGGVAVGAVGVPTGA